MESNSDFVLLQRSQVLLPNNLTLISLFKFTIPLP
jgi:hypothetical protein